MCGIFSIQLKNGTEPLRLYAPRSIAAGLREKAKVELDRMLTMGVIEPVEEPTQWCSGLTTAPKPNDGIHMCVDLTALNRGVKGEVYPFPIVSEMLSKLAERKVFSKLDAQGCGRCGWIWSASSNRLSLHPGGGSASGGCRSGSPQHRSSTSEPWRRSCMAWKESSVSRMRCWCMGRAKISTG